jgi:hypothetical protein
MHLMPAYIVWPSATERIARMHEKHSIFRRAVGFVDGCEIPLQFEPKNHHETYYSRHKQYGFQMQVVCDWDARIRYAYTGNQASVQDSTALRTTGLWRERDRYFADEEYLIGDKGYFIDKHLIIPYKQPLAGRLEGAEKFNDTIASVCTPDTNCNRPKLINKNKKERVRIEHVFGRLKARWRSLRCLPIHIGDNVEYDHRRANEWMMACAVLHNILQDIAADEAWLEQELAVDDLVSSNEEGGEDETAMGAVIRAQFSSGTAANRGKQQGLVIRELLRQKTIAEYETLR